MIEFLQKLEAGNVKLTNEMFLNHKDLLKLRHDLIKEHAPKMYQDLTRRFPSYVSLSGERTINENIRRCLK